MRPNMRVSVKLCAELEKQGPGVAAIFFVIRASTAILDRGLILGYALVYKVAS